MKLYMGIDSSTQGIKAVIVNPEKMEIIATEAVNFANEIGEKYDSPEAVLKNPDPLIKHSNPLMWIEGIEILMERLQKKSVPLENVCAISGCGQQHGSVYLNSKFEKIISSLDSTKKLHEQIAPALSRESSPIWMDSSTSEQCKILSDKIGMEKVRQITGSAPIERFTGPQIMKFFQTEPQKYHDTRFIHLVSSFMASVLSGKSAPIDYGDGAGMNMMNIQTLNWDENIAKVIAPEILNKIPPLSKTTAILGNINHFFTKYGFSPNTKIAVWTGDNPASLVGTGAASGSVAVISLGTSDTFFCAMEKPHTDPNGCGHVFGNPGGGFMSLICFKNGSLAREKIKNEFNVTWEYFGNNAFRNTKPGGGTNNIILPRFVPEITPLRLKTKLTLSGSEEFKSGQNKDLSIRAIVESQMLAIKIHSEWVGQNFKTIRITGGGSKNPGICQTAADVFSATVETIAIPDSAALGAAMIAAVADGSASFSELAAIFAKPVKTIKPRLEYKEIYAEMLEKYKLLESEEEK